LFLTIKIPVNNDKVIIGSAYDSFKILSEKIEVSQIFGVYKL